jgi:hypothetical protein
MISSMPRIQSMAQSTSKLLMTLPSLLSIIYIHKPVSSGVLRAEGRMVSGTSRHFVGESILSVEGIELARGSGTFLRSKMELSKTAGYQ